MGKFIYPKSAQPVTAEVGLNQAIELYRAYIPNYFTLPILDKFSDRRRHQNTTPSSKSPPRTVVQTQAVHGKSRTTLSWAVCFHQSTEDKRNGQQGHALLSACICIPGKAKWKAEASGTLGGRQPQRRGAEVEGKHKVPCEEERGEGFLPREANYGW